MNPTGLLAIWNRIAPEHDAEFNAWYEAEHLDQRLAVPGFHSARRYRALDDRYAYSALYELDAPGVLQSPAYRAPLADPTPRTRAIMPHFIDMTRGACLVTFDSAPAAPAGHLLAVLFLPQAAGEISGPFDGVRIRSVVPDAAATGGVTPEQKLRGQADRLPPPFVLIEGNDEATVTAHAQRLRDSLGADTPRLYTLISARVAAR
ncbi:MAG: hypothetical protein KIS79_15995 [Burkholderiales bacterium]|nr:hypothetical protein [Burkholderiales bacterium]